MTIHNIFLASLRGTGAAHVYVKDMSIINVFTVHLHVISAIY